MPVTPTRICDTRPGNPSGLSGAILANCEGKDVAPGSPLSVQVSGLGGVPLSATAAVVNLTVNGDSSASYLTAWAAGGPAPASATSVENWPPGGTVAVSTIVPVVPNDDQILLEDGSGSAQAVVDVFGWAVPIPTSSSSASSPSS